MDPRATLLAEIARKPNDDQLLRVYADLLQQEGDPRGELISLQLAQAGAARVAELLALHRAAWIGPLVACVKLDHCRFARGFVDEVEVDPFAVAAVVGDPHWATVTKIHLGTLRGDVRGALREIGALIAHPVMRSLETVTERGVPLLIEREPAGGCAFVPRFG